MTKTVVVPLDDSDLAARALPVAEALADAAGADVETISVPPSASVADAIVDDAVGFPEPVIVMATHGRSAFGELVLGSVTDDVIRRSPVPVVVVGPHAEAAPLGGDGPVLVAVDGSAGDRAVLDAAAGFARTLDAPVVVVHVVVPMPPVDGGRDLEVDVEVADHAAEQLRAAGVAAAELTIDAAYPAGEIVRSASHRQARLLVVGTRRPGRLERAVLGSTALAIVRRAPCPTAVIGR